MSKDFRHAQFGLVPAELTLQRMEACETILKSFLKNVNKLNLLGNVESHQEVFSIAKEYIGEDFKNWLYVNFWNGNGARKELARKIVAYVDGKVSGKAVTSQVRVDINRLGYHVSGRPTTTPILYDEYDPVRNNFKIENVDFSNIEDRHFYDFIALLGPELTCAFLLSINGVQHV